jgi:hypothetical protein
MRAGSPVLALSLRDGFCDEIGIKHSGRLHSGDALYRRCVARWRLCIICIVFSISPHKSALSVKT